jgi:hypothetical protein
MKRTVVFDEKQFNFTILLDLYLFTYTFNLYIWLYFNILLNIRERASLFNILILQFFRNYFFKVYCYFQQQAINCLFLLTLHSKAFRFNFESSNFQIKMTTTLSAMTTTRQSFLSTVTLYSLLWVLLVGTGARALTCFETNENVSF